MILKGKVGRVLVGTLVVLPRLVADDIFSHLFIPKHLEWRVMIQVGLRRKVGNHIFIMHNSIKTVNPRGKILSQSCVSDPRAAKVVNMNLTTIEFLLEP